MSVGKDKIYFVYIGFYGKVQMQKWYGEKLNSVTGKQLIPLQSHELSDSECNLTFEELSQKYPFVVKEPQNDN